jgi:putative endonuclease
MENTNLKRDYNFWVYILTNWKKSVLYVGMTNNLSQRLVQHYENRGERETFAGRYHCYNLVYYEWHQYVLNAISREKEIKMMLREHKEALITSENPEWKFFNAFICGEWPPNVPVPGE